MTTSSDAYKSSGFSMSDTADFRFQVEDTDGSEYQLPRSPNVREYVASFEMQLQRLCRGKDEVRLHHERPPPPCKTQSAVMKARHLRAASEDYSRSDRQHAAVNITGRSVAELKNALLSSTKLMNDEIGRTYRPISENENEAMGVRFVENRKGPKSRYLTFTGACDTSELSETETPRSSGTATVPDVDLDSSSSPSGLSDEAEDQLKLATPGGGGEVTVFSPNDSAGEDVGYFSLPGRRLDRSKHRLSPDQLSHPSAVEDGSPALGSDPVGTLSPSAHNTSQECPSNDDVAASPNVEEQLGVRTPSPSSAIVFHDQEPDPNHHHSASSGAAEDEQQDLPQSTSSACCNQTSCEEDNISVVRKLSASPEELSQLMVTSFGSCDQVVVDTVSVLRSYRTALDYVSPLFPESGPVQRCFYDLSASCRPDNSSAGVQFLTLEAIREAARRRVECERDVINNVRKSAEADEEKLQTLEPRVLDIIKHRTDSRLLDKYKQYANEQERVTRLLLLLAARLARHYNATLLLAPPGESPHTTPKSLTTNRDDLTEKFDDASALKTDIDRRGQAISDTLLLQLTETELADYRSLVRGKIRVRLQRQEADDWMRIVLQQLEDLRPEVDEAQQLTSQC